MMAVTHLFVAKFTLAPPARVEVACGKTGVEWKNAESQTDHVTCKRCLERFSASLNGLFSEVHKSVVADKVMASREVRFAIAGLKEKFADAVETMRSFAVEAERVSSNLDRAIYYVAAGSGFTTPMDVAMNMQRTAVDALNNVRTDLLAKYAARLEAVIADAKIAA